MVAAAVGVHEDSERRQLVALVGGGCRGLAEGDDSDGGVTELVQTIAHGDRVFPAGQSGEVAMKDEHHRPSVAVLQPPTASVVLGQIDGRSHISD